MKTKLVLITLCTTVLFAAATICSFAESKKFFSNERKIVEQLREDMTNRKTNITLYYKSARTLTKKDLNGWLEDALAETGNPEEGDYLRWSCRKSTASVSSKTNCYREREHKITYKITYYTTAKQEAYVSKRCDEILRKLDVDSARTDYEKIIKIYNYICDNVDYAYNKGNSANSLLRYSAYGALYNGKAVCLGYTALFYRLLNQAGIKNRIIYGMSDDGAHAWNIVKIGSRYYNTDVCWDAGRNQYKWFLVGSNNFVQHTRDKAYRTSSFQKQYPIASNNWKLTAPSGLSLTTVASSGKPQLTWKTVNNADKYEVYRATRKCGTYKKVCTTKKTKYVNTSSVAGVTYYYKVKAIDKDNIKAASNYSIIKSITCDLAKPKEVKVTRKKNDGKLKISWKTVQGADCYGIYRATSAKGTYKKIYTTKKTSYTNTLAAKGNAYYYKIKAVKKEKASANSAFSEYSSVAPLQR